MEETFKLITKYLQRKKWEYDGTQYVFRTAEPNDSFLQCLVDCVLPKKGQSYARLKFGYDLQRILENIYDMFGEKIAFEVEFFVDGNVAEEVYLSDETKKRIRQELKELYWFKIQTAGFDTSFSCELKVFPSFVRKPYVDNESVTFNFFIDIFNLTYKDKRVTLKDSDYNQGKSWIEDVMWDHDFATDVSDYFYTACEPEFKFGSTDDLFINATGRIRKIDGVEKGNGKWTLYDKESIDNYFQEK